MIIALDKLEQYAAALGVLLDEAALNRFEIYAEQLVEYNKKVNLTAITDSQGILIKHFTDSLSLLKFVTPEKNASICDVGTGAGFPGVALKIARPDLQITLFDSVNKKLEFIRLLLNELKLDAQVITIRAEDAGRNEAYREKFDVVTARAVASLNVLSEYCVPLVRVGGVFAPLKAVLTAEEEQRGFGALANLGCKVKAKQIYELPDNSSREIIIAEKISQTNSKYPRNSAQISKKPL